jgi:HAE1 family hydrophobic/amphiphilic exporter-1
VKIFDFAVKRPVAVAMIVLIVVLLGVVSYSRLGMNLFPEMELPMLLIQTSYSGVGPQEIEEQLTRPLEAAVGTVSGVQEITSYSSRGSSMLLVEFNWGADLNYATNQLRDRLDMYGAALPSDASKPVIIKMDPSSMPIMQIGMSGDATLEELTDYMQNKVRPNLERIDGVASVNESGAVTEEIRVTTDPQRLQAYGVSMNQIMALLRQENANASAGRVEEGMIDHAIRVVGEFNDVEDIRNLQVQSAYGGYIPLRSLASVERTIKDRSSYVFVNGKPGINVSLMKQSDANLVQTSARVRETLGQLSAELPGGYEMFVAFDQADYVNLSLHNVIDSALQGSALAVLILILFLRSWRSTLIIAICIPVSVVAAFAMMFFTDVTLNMVSLGGLALGVGMMVDNSIVILENIFRFRQEEGASNLEAAINGGKEVAGAVIASTVTTIVVFLPIVFVEGLASQIFRQMALTITCSLLASLGVAFLTVPMLSNKILVKEKEKKRNARLMPWIKGRYSRFLAWSLRHKGVVVLFFTAALVGSALLLPYVGMEFIPAQDTGEYSVSVSLPRGVALRETLRVAREVEAILDDIPENARVMGDVGGGGGIVGLSLGGGGGSSGASFTGSLVPLGERGRSIDEIMDDIRGRLGAIPGIEYEVSSSGGLMLMMGSDIVIYLLGDDLEQLKIIADSVARRVETIDGTREVTTSLETGNPEINVFVDRQKASQYGLNSATVAATVSAAVSGISPTKLREGGKEMDISLIMDARYRENLNDLEALTIASPTGNLIPLGSIASLQIETSPVSIIRQNQSRQVSVSCTVTGRSLGDVAADVQSALDQMNIPPEVRIDMGGSNREMVDAFNDLYLALALAVVLVYMVMAFQFEQLLYPFVIMFALPPTFIGVILCLYITGRTLNVVSLIGVIMLVGIVVNNAIVLVDYINILRRQKGRSREEAIVEAGLTRFRPIMMTSLTTILGMLPIAIGLGEGQEMMAPLGTVVAGGLAFSTFITLVYVPCMYVYAEDITNGIRRLFRRKPAVVAVEIK